jgi:hypothetical protein
MNQRISESVNAMSENGKMGKRGPTFARGLPPPASATARQDGPAEQARVLPKKQSAAVERRNFFRLFPPFPPLTAFQRCFFIFEDMRLTTKQPRNESTKRTGGRVSDIQLSQLSLAATISLNGRRCGSDAEVTQVTQSDAEVTQPFLQINGLRGLRRLGSHAFLRDPKRSRGLKDGKIFNHG